MSPRAINTAIATLAAIQLGLWLIDAGCGGGGVLIGLFAYGIFRRVTSILFPEGAR